MGSAVDDSAFGPVVAVSAAPADAEVIVVCEHAANRIPKTLGDLGVPPAHLTGHIAWDPGALALAREVSAAFGAPLVEGRISRLVYDCNRPPEARDAIPERSDGIAVPGNAALSGPERAARVAAIHDAFHDRLSAEIRQRRGRLRLMVTVHSFTPVYQGRAREVHLGILHGRDPRFAMEMFGRRPDDLPHEVRLNEPYSARDGVAYTLDHQGHRHGLLNVMLEVRNDLLDPAQGPAAWAGLLVPWLAETFAALKETAP